VQYGNRKQAEDGLSQFLSHIVIAPNLARSITSGPVNRVFQEAVREMNAIYQNVHDTQPQPWSANVPPSQTTAGREMQTHVYKLRCVAVTRVRYVVGSGRVECPRGVCTAFLPPHYLKILPFFTCREYFLAQMALLRRPQTNVRMIQVHGLLQYAYLQDFLTEANPQIATEIWNVYIESMSKVSHLKSGLEVAILT
jgi:Vps52 / Sac2 family